jgi:formate dehydrogenase maturation protein FdhE
MQPCPQCRSINVIIVHMSIGDAPVRFSSCRSCENRWWTDLNARRQLALDEVLDLVAA